MFWLRFFTGPTRVRDCSTPSALNFASSATAPSCTVLDTLLQVEPEAPESFDDFPQRRARGGRRSALDLPSAGYSLDLGPQVVRLSFDAFSTPSFRLLNLLQGYTNIQTFHRGSRTRILRAQMKSSGKEVLFKLYDKTVKSTNQIQGISKELDVLKMSFNGVVKLVDIVEDEKLILLVLEECMNGTLMAVMDEFGGLLSEGQCIRNLARPVLKILCDLHTAGIVHRNVKPEHILFDDQLNPRLCDFFVAGFSDRDPFTDREGTLSYMAPEVIAKPTPEEIFHIVISNGMDETDLPSYDEKVDIWSLGVIIVEAVTGCLPFVADTPEGMMQVVSDHFSGHSVSPILQHLTTSGQLSGDGIDFITIALQQNPNDRPDARSLLTHPWILSAQ